MLPGEYVLRDTRKASRWAGICPQDLPGASAPTFMVYSLRDAQEANLDRIQIIKGWVEDGETVFTALGLARRHGQRWPRLAPIVVKQRPQHMVPYRPARALEALAHESLRDCAQLT